jgi:mRNA-degrading endonuclease YafQ of YafQ-DinJ toxin-antitoxin module
LKRPLLNTPAFARAARRFLARHPAAASDVQAALESLEHDAFASALKTHKLKGRLSSCWACSAGYDIRIVFELVPHLNSEALLLRAIGTHDEVY